MYTSVEETPVRGGDWQRY